MSMISFGNIALPLAPEIGIGDVLVNEGTEAPKLHLSSVGVYMPTSAAGGLLLVGTASTTLRTIFPPPPLPWSFCGTIEERNFRTTTAIQQFAKYSSFWHRKVI